MSGVYKITNKTTNRFYIGSARDLHKRWSDHLLRLKTNRHVNGFLQSDFNMFGETNFVFEVLEYTTPSEMLSRENEYLKTLRPHWPLGYNILDCAAGGDFKYHPKKDEIYQKYLVNNSGNENPFHGKQHSVDTITKMKLSASKRTRRPFSIETTACEREFVENASQTIHSVKGIVRLASERGLVLGRSKVKRILQSHQSRNPSAVAWNSSAFISLADVSQNNASLGRVTYTQTDPSRAKVTFDPTGSLRRRAGAKLLYPSSVSDFSPSDSLIILTASFTETGADARKSRLRSFVALPHSIVESQ